MHTLETLYHDSVRWDSRNLEHPTTFETLALEPEMKNTISEDSTTTRMPPLENVAKELVVAN